MSVVTTRRFCFVFPSLRLFPNHHPSTVKSFIAYDVVSMRIPIWVVFAYFLFLYFNCFTLTSAMDAGSSKDQISCTMCDACDNPCQPLPSPPPPVSSPPPPPTQESEYPPPPSQPSPGTYYYSPPPPSQYVYPPPAGGGQFYPPPNSGNFPAPPPPNPILPYFPFYYYNPPPAASESEVKKEEEEEVPCKVIKKCELEIGDDAWAMGNWKWKSVPVGINTSTHVPCGC